MAASRARCASIAKLALSSATWPCSRAFLRRGEVGEWRTVNGPAVRSFEGRNGEGVQHEAYAAGRTK